jgi:glyoxylase-like metal-dependent hydrolase (beta-lactamase superfamily II)
VIHCLPIPTPFAVGRVNVYLVEDDPLTLVDAGPNSGTSLTTLEGALAEHRRKVEDLERIVVTHQHMDHIGLVEILASRSGAEVVALEKLAPWLANYSEGMEADDEFSDALMARNGIPDDVRHALRAVSTAYRAWGAAATVTTTVAEGDVIGFADRSWTVFHRPGHSPSDTVFHDSDRGELIGGDHLIKHISSNAVISRPLDGGDPADRPQALAIYLDSLAKTRAMEIVRVLPGHGEEIHEHAELIEERFRLHERRARKLLGLIADQPRTAYELAQAMWGNVAVTQAYLTLSEVLGHVDLLRNDGHVVEHDDGGVARFAVA